jgi:tetratricopeptide (TPR) repeat protein
MRKSIIVYLILFIIISSATHIYAQEGFYELDDSVIEFRPVLYEEHLGKEIEGYTWHTDSKGKKYYIADKPAISSNDIRVVALQKTKYIRSEGEGYTIVFYFTQSSWDKVRSITSQMITERLGIFLNGEFQSAPKIFEAFDYRAMISSLNEEQAKDFVKVLKKGVRLDEEKLEIERIRWLEERTAEALDNSILRELFSYYTREKWRDCDKAKALADRLNRDNLAFSLYDCYKHVGRYDEALAELERAKLLMEHSEWSYFGARSEIYFLMGKNEQAFDSISKALELLRKDDSVPSRESFIEYYERKKQEIQESLE